MEVRQSTFYNIVLTDKEASDFVTAFEKVYAAFASVGDLNAIEPISKLKDEIILAANKG